jgi:hypothetical protein
MSMMIAKSQFCHRPIVHLSDENNKLHRMANMILIYHYQELFPELSFEKCVELAAKNINEILQLVIND